MRPSRVLLFVPAVALAVSACGAAAVSGSGAPAGSGPAASTGTGIAGLPAAEILTRTKAAYGRAATLHVTGLVKGGTETIRGVLAIRLDNPGGSDLRSLYVAATGAPVPLRITETGSGSGTLDLVYGEPVNIEVPPAAETIDVTKLSD